MSLRPYGSVSYTHLDVYKRQDYSYLAESDAADSIAQRINRTIQAHVLGKEYIRMNPEVAEMCIRDRQRCGP